MDGTKLADIKSETDRPISFFTQSQKFGDNILYWQPREDADNGFEFIFLEWTSAEGPDYDDINNQYFETAFQGYAFFDGIRHIRFFPNSDCGSGYSYYPRISQLIIVLERLKELEIQFCRDAKD